MQCPRPHAAFELGYLAACAGLARQVPAELRRGYPDLSGEWLAGYDDAEGDSPEMRAWMVEGFG